MQKTTIITVIFIGTVTYKKKKTIGTVATIII